MNASTMFSLGQRHYHLLAISPKYNVYLQVTGPLALIDYGWLLVSYMLVDTLVNYVELIHSFISSELHLIFEFTLLCKFNNSL